jgi:hypothetical protein
MKVIKKFAVLFLFLAFGVSAQVTKDSLLRAVNDLDFTVLALKTSFFATDTNGKKQQDLWQQIRVAEMHMPIVVFEGKDCTHTKMTVHNHMLQIEGLIVNLNQTSMSADAKAKVAALLVKVKAIEVSTAP